MIRDHFEWDFQFCGNYKSDSRNDILQWQRSKTTDMSLILSQSISLRTPFRASVLKVLSRHHSDHAFNGKGKDDNGELKPPQIGTNSASIYGALAFE